MRHKDALAAKLLRPIWKRGCSAADGVDDFVYFSSCILVGGYRNDANESRKSPRIGSARKRRARKAWIEVANARPTSVVIGCRVPHDFHALRD